VENIMERRIIAFAIIVLCVLIAWGINDKFDAIRADMRKEAIADSLYHAHTDSMLKEFIVTWESNPKAAARAMKMIREERERAKRGRP
jgi:hypothetical protein